MDSDETQSNGIRKGTNIDSHYHFLALTNIHTFTLQFASDMCTSHF